MQSIIKVAVETKLALPIEVLTPFQDDLKTLSKEQYEKLRKSIIDFGFSFPIFIWKNGKKNYILDGHQRRLVLLQMAKNEGYKVPKLPVVVVAASSYSQAKKKLLAVASQYGIFSEEGFHSFLKTNKMQFDEIVAICNFPDFDFGDFSEKFLNLKVPDAISTPASEGPEMKSGSDGVKQVQLFFGSAQHLEFMQKIDELATSYGTDNVTDTVMESIRADHKAKFSKP